MASKTSDKAGGGVAYLRTLGILKNAKLPEEEQQGLNIIRRALEEPLRQIAANAGSHLDSAFIMS